MDQRCSGTRCQVSKAVNIARKWLGTPYVHQASNRGVGTDCLGLIRGVWRELYGREPEDVPPYTPDWSEAGSDEDLLAAAGRLMLPIALTDALPGDVIVFRMRRNGVAKHLGILSESRNGDRKFIHAYDRQGVVESPLSNAWASRIAGAFRLP